MSLDPTLFTDTKYELANEAFLFCKDCLEKRGDTDTADALDGFTPINDSYSVEMALRALHRNKPRMPSAVHCYVDIARDALLRIHRPLLQAA